MVRVWRSTIDYSLRSLRIVDGIFNRCDALPASGCTDGIRAGSSLVEAIRVNPKAAGVDTEVRDEVIVWLW